MCIHTYIYIYIHMTPRGQMGRRAEGRMGAAGPGGDLMVMIITYDHNTNNNNV